MILSNQSLAQVPGLDVLLPLPNQPYALCAGAISFNYDGVTYAKCRKLFGNSLGIKHPYPPTILDKNVQDVNIIGTSHRNNTFTVSTYSPPDPYSYALYTCTKPGAFAQCDGGICFANTSGAQFPGVGLVRQDEIICSCPIVNITNPDVSKPTSIYHVIGPAKCPTQETDYDAVCGSNTAQVPDMRADGVILHIGSSGPTTVAHAENAYYDRIFNTRSYEGECKRPGN